MPIAAWPAGEWSTMFRAQSSAVCLPVSLENRAASKPPWKSFMRFFSDDSQHRPTEPDLAQAARELLVARPFRNDDHDRDTRLERLIKAALSGPEGPETARVLSRNFVLAVANSDTYA